MSEQADTWLRTQVARYRAEQPRYELMSEMLQRVLSAAARLTCIDPIVQARAKSLPSFAEKAVRKRRKYADPVSQLTDLCGARVLMQTPEEIEGVSGYIRSHFQVDEANSLDTSARLPPPPTVVARRTEEILEFLNQLESKVTEMVLDVVVEGRESETRRPRLREMRLRRVSDPFDQWIVAQED